MAKVVRIFEFTLNCDVQAEEFERFVTEELTKTPFASGIQIRFLKCDRDSQGEFSRMYINELEFESAEVRDSYFPMDSKAQKNLISGGQNMAPYGTSFIRW